MDNNDSDTFNIIASRSFIIEHDPIIKETKKKKDPTSDDTIKNQLGKRKKRNYLNF